MKDQMLGKEVVETGKVVAKAFGQFFLEHCEDPLKPIEGRIFGYLSRNPNVTAQDIAKHFSLSKSSVSESMSTLLGRGYITYEKSKEDGREKTIALTDVGRGRSNSYLKIVTMFEEKLENGFTKEEKERLLSLLEKVKKEVFANGK